MPLSRVRVEVLNATLKCLMLGLRCLMPLSRVRVEVFNATLKG